VDPELTLSCKKCHATGADGAPVFLDSDPQASYARIRARQDLYQPPQNSQLLLHGEHTGPALTPSQATKVTAWLNLEFPGTPPSGTATSTSSGWSGSSASSSASGSPPPGTGTAASALDDFGKCMSYDDWTNTGMDKFPQNQTQFGPCEGCHEHGNGGTFLSADPVETFNRNRAAPYVNKLVRARYENGAFAGLEPNDRFIKKGATSCVGDDICHPEYVLPVDQVNALEAFQSKTLLKMNGAVCANP
jgi:hypothetical protein